MGLITSTGIFKYIPPNPQITSTSTPTGNLGQIVSIYGSAAGGATTKTTSALRINSGATSVASVFDVAECNVAIFGN